MKRPIIFVISALLAVTSVCALAGCGSKESGSSAAKSEAAQSSAAAGSSQASAAGDANSSQAADAVAFSAEDVIFSYNGVSVELNSDANAAIEALGEYQEVTSQMSCHGEGEDKTYTYEGFVLNTYPLDGEDRVLEIVIKSADIPTAKGVKIGDTAETVKTVYGDGFKAVGVYYAYDNGDGKSLQFTIENDVVTEISFYYDV